MKLTLQSRITNLMIVSSLLLIAAFTFIQLNNQIQNISRYNSYEANLSTVLVKNNLQAMIQNSSAEDLPGLLRTAIKSLSETGMVKHLAVFDREGKIIASSENQTGESVSYRDLNKAEDLQTLLSQNKWYLSSIDHHQFNVYVALVKDQAGPLAYVAKISLPLANIPQALNQVYFPVLIAILIVIAANIILGYLLSRKVIGPIKMLNEVTKIIAAGDLAVRTSIHTQDEIEELGATFNYMTAELVKMKERAENANPLTKLPGNIAIHEQIDKRISEKSKFTVIYCDLDNFKAFNDKYGIGKGDEAIKLAAGVFKQALKTQGNPDDFLGHEGGDDFILLTTPEKTEEMTSYIIAEFDKRVRSLYSAEDLKAGKIIAHSRDGAVREFPIMTISLAGVTNAHRPIASYGEITNIAAEVKKKAKEISGSSFVLDKRQD